ncbi:MAG: type I 3-dehydroquinate dehydratase [Eubacterium sp.]|nr:type I 3-dehydroquinate dehydratase [Eubacterium sp.]
MNELTVGGFTFGDGTPRICVPLIGRTEEEILKHADLIRKEIDRLDGVYSDTPELKVAVIEWRADYFDNLADLENLQMLLNNLRMIFSDRLLLFTFRSEEQGGELRHDRVGSNLEPIMKTVITSGAIDLLDVEVTYGNYKIVRATTRAHEAGIKVVMSYHDFNKTPHDSELEDKLRDMEILGGDILKIAVMPKNEFDVRRVMELNRRMVDESFKPIVLISMGDIGMASRFKCRETGACLTFGMMGEESATGQIEASDLMALLKNQI